MYIYIYVYIYTYNIYIYIYIYTYIYIHIYILRNWWRRKTYLGSHHKASLHFVLEPACLQVSADAAQRERSTDLARWKESDGSSWGYCFHTPKTRKQKQQNNKEAKTENKQKPKHKHHTALRLFTAVVPLELICLFKIWLLTHLTYAHVARKCLENIARRKVPATSLPSDTKKNLRNDLHEMRRVQPPISNMAADQAYGSIPRRRHSNLLLSVNDKSWCPNRPTKKLQVEIESWNPWASSKLDPACQ